MWLRNGDYRFKCVYLTACVSVHACVCMCVCVCVCACVCVCVCVDMKVLVGKCKVWRINLLYEGDRVGSRL